MTCLVGRVPTHAGRVVQTATGFFAPWPFLSGAGEVDAPFGLPPPLAAGAEAPAFGLGERPRRGFGFTRWSFLRLGEFSRPLEELRLLSREEERPVDRPRLSDLDRSLGLSLGVPGAADDEKVGVTWGSSHLSPFLQLPLIQAVQLFL